MRRGLLVLTVAAALATAATAPAAPQSGTTVKAAKNAHLGGAAILVTGKGMTLYMYVDDASGSSACVNDSTYHCSKHWPPLLTIGDPVAGPGVRQSLLGTITRPEGTTQVTYKGHPLYTFVSGYGGPADKKAGDVAGQGFVSIWWVVSPTGALIKKSPKP